ncbi:MAG TPA: PaaI family thioesterase [Myxococcota bacterium]|nr:PaaI family thioesterase [Myxococcota bacterium]
MSASFAARFDPEVAQGFIRANDRLTGLPKYLGLRIVDVGPGTLRAEMAVREDLLTPFKTMHGGVISAVCDHVLGCVCYPLMARGQWAATTEFKLNLLAPVTKGVLAANAAIVSMSKTLAVVRIDVANDDRLVAIAQGTVTIRDPKG